MVNSLREYVSDHHAMRSLILQPTSELARVGTRGKNSNPQTLDLSREIFVTMQVRWSPKAAGQVSDLNTYWDMGEQLRLYVRLLEWRQLHKQLHIINEGIERRLKNKRKLTKGIT